MIGEHTLYRKIQSVLDIAQKGATSSYDELINEVLNRNLINFLYVRFDKKTEEEVAEQSLSSIRKTIKICSELGFLKENGTLTSVGIKALNTNNFNQILGTQVIRYFENRDIAIQALEKQIVNMLQSSPTILPTAKALWASISPPMNFNTFSLMMTLLAHCKKIIAARNKIYLGFNK